MSDPQNPYAPPQAPSLARAGSFNASGPAAAEYLYPAERGTRLGASLIDATIGLVVTIPLQFAAGVYKHFPDIKLTIQDQIMWGAIGFVIWLLIHAWFLRNGQTLGKRLLKIQIVNVHDSRPPSLLKIAFLRYLPVSVVAQAPIVGGLVALVDALMIFGQDRRCLHDVICGTKVVRLPPNRR